ncbi:PREDICTED: uncharacterized protein LOC108748833 [Trachymyrmex septentrionalis]|uniref:uncharacterized protein LOC108748833 n=1 Tax=Trachymyrmex septentrionalis TaxID=34720 RepID=UPI00084EEB5E|nr:PREDICTED: uncharacterized protein LOC108748833 [Trachymyrmex septentrionalis]
MRYEEEDGDCVALPKRATWKVTQQMHRLLLHFGTDNVIGFMEQYFHWFDITKVARDVVASCHTCLATKYYSRSTEGVQYYELPKVPGIKVSMDIFGPLPKIREGYGYLLVIMDQFSKYTKLYSMANQTLETIIGILWDLPVLSREGYAANR